MAIQVRVKRWGSSMGIILPKIVVEKENLRENDKIFVNVVKEADMKGLFGSLKRKISGQEFKDEIRKGWEK